MPLEPDEGGFRIRPPKIDPDPGFHISPPTVDPDPEFHINPSQFDSYPGVPLDAEMRPGMTEAVELMRSGLAAEQAVPLAMEMAEKQAAGADKGGQSQASPDSDSAQGSDNEGDSEAPGVARQRRIDAFIAAGMSPDLAAQAADSPSFDEGDVIPGEVAGADLLRLAGGNEENGTANSDDSAAMRELDRRAAEGFKGTALDPDRGESTEGGSSSNEDEPDLIASALGVPDAVVTFFEFLPVSGQIIGAARVGIALDDAREAYERGDMDAAREHLGEALIEGGATMAGPFGRAARKIHKTLGVKSGKTSRREARSSGPGEATPNTLSNRIAEDPFAQRQAERMSEQARKDVEILKNRFIAGNRNPGLGSKRIAPDIWELRGKNAGRVIVKKTDEDRYDVIGEFQGHRKGDDENARIINRLIKDYNDRRKR